MRNDAPPLTPVHHVFVDFENVHAVDLAVFNLRPVSFTLLLGAKQSKLDAALVEKLMEHAASVELVRLTSSGKDALDFTLAYYVGRAALADPTGHFHIIAKDSGYDPLIEHLRSRNIHAQRHADFAALTGRPAAPTAPAKKAPAKTPAKAAAAKAKPSASPKEDRAAQALEHLRAHPLNRPKREAKLMSHLRTVFGRQLDEQEVAKVVERLREAGHIVISDKGAVSYHLS